MDIICKDESYRIMGASFDVYKQMGHGYLEAVYIHTGKRTNHERHESHEEVKKV